jgi:hypothetical protein
MANFRNALEDSVVRAAQIELANLEGDPKIPNLVEVVAYTLNRLPPKYATTHRGWLKHREAVLKTMQLQILETIHRGIQVLRLGDPLHDSNPIPEREFQCKSMTLVRLRKLLDCATLEWQDIPGALSQKLAQIEQHEYEFSTVPNLQQTIKYSGMSPANRQALSAMSNYVNRRKTRNWRSSSDNFPQSTTSVKTSSKNIFDLDLTDSRDVLKLYTLKADLGFSNVLENLVLSAVDVLIQKVNSEWRSQINLSEAAAYALNRLPPMYATSERGWQVLRRKAKEELSREILLQVQTAITQVRNSRNSKPQPLPFQKFDLDYDAALLQLKMILQKEDVTWLNVADLIEAQIATARRKYA